MPAPPTAADPPELDRRLLAAQVALLFERTRASAWTNLSAAMLLSALLLGRVALPGLVVWLVLKVAAIAVRQWVRWRYRRPGRWSDADWRRWFTTVVVVDGCLWGLAGVMFLPQVDGVIEALLLVTLVAVVAIAAMVLPVYGPLHLGFSAGVLLPAAATELFSGGVVGLYGGIGLLLFQAFLLFEGRTSGRHTNELLRLRLLLEQEAAAHAQALALAERHSAVKSQFLATMSHEMRTPLHGILGLAEQLRDAGGAPDQRARKLALIERSGEHLLGLISDVLDFARIEAGRLQLADEPFDLGAVIEEVALLAGGRAGEKGLSIEVDTGGLGAAGGWMRGDAARVRQVLHNLIGNAVKFTDEGGVRIRALRDPETARVRIEVEDSGRGIPPSQLEFIFDAFHQADGNFDRRFGGAGLGLTIARELARAMGGRLDAHSAPGVGSVFTFEVPLPPDLPDTQPPPTDLPGLPQRLLGRVLVAEDNPVNALVVEAMLREAGLEVDLVENGAQAVQRWEASSPDLLLMDCQMPELDGFAATREIRDRERRQGRPRMPIVALTANAHESDRDRCFEAGMDEHLAKPFRARELNELLARYLAPAEARGGLGPSLRLDITV